MKISHIFSWILLLAATVLCLEARDKVIQEPLAGNIINEVIIPSAVDKPAEKISGDIKCILFDNMDAYHYVAYYQYIASSEYSDKFTRASFTDDFFQKNKITDFDLAIFPMGNYVLNAKTPGGIKVINKIMEMINAGKKVMITGNVMMLAAFRSQVGDDAAVKLFFNNTLQVDYLGYRPTCDSVSDGTNITVTFREFISRGGLSDPVSLSAIKHCNATFNGATPLNPYCFNVDVFKIKENSPSKPVDHFLITTEQVRNDTLLGLRYEKENGGKLVFWSMGFEYIATDFARQFLTTSAIRWLLKSGPAPGPSIEFVPTEINFGAIDIGQSAKAEFIVRNAGTGNLKITKMEFSFGVEAFSLVSGMPKFPLNIAPDSTLAFEVKFAPTENYNYVDYLDFTSNAVEGEVQGVELKGKGGIGLGPKISLSTRNANFGAVKPLSSSYADIEYKNIGNMDLVVNMITIENNDLKAFTFVQGGGVPVTLAPNESRKMRIKFVPQEAGAEYNSLLKILSTSMDEPEVYVPLTGSGLVESNGPIITLSAETIDFGAAFPQAPETAVIRELTIQNTGKAPLSIDSLIIKDDELGNFALLNPPQLPATIEPSSTLSLSLKFYPTTNDLKEFISWFNIYSNADNMPEYKVRLIGIATIESVEDQYAGLFSVYPNPSSGDFFVTFGEDAQSTLLVDLAIYDFTGRKACTLFNGAAQAGSIRLSGFNLTPGLYNISGWMGSRFISYPLIISD